MNTLATILLSVLPLAVGWAVHVRCLHARLSRPHGVTR